MIYYIKEGQLIKKDQTETLLSHPAVIFSNLSEAEPYISNFQFPHQVLKKALTNDEVVYENHHDFDFFSIHLMSGHADKVYIYINNQALLFISKAKKTITDLMINALKEDDHVYSLEGLLLLFFELQVMSNPQNLQTLEITISDLENKLLEGESINITLEISQIRKTLMEHKHYYEQLLFIFDMLEINEDRFLDDHHRRTIAILSNRLNRLHNSVLNLRDYLTQVRESYQAEVDINLNRIMKIFTVITAIFLPLSLIVGWYGMNIKMPETQWVYIYPTIIVLSFAIAGLSLLYFKRNKWF